MSLLTKPAKILNIPTSLAIFPQAEATSTGNARKETPSLAQQEACCQDCWHTDLLG